MGGTAGAAQAKSTKTTDKATTSKATVVQKEKYITRSGFVGMLHKTLNIQICYFRAPDITEIYDDVKKDAPYADMLYDLATLGIIDCKGSFNPNGALTREEMVHFVINGYNYVYNTRLDTGDIQGAESRVEKVKAFKAKISAKKFNDSNKVKTAYVGDVKMAAELGLILGKANGAFGPKDKATVTAAKIVIERLSNLLDTLLGTGKPSGKIGVGVYPSIVNEGGTFKMELTLVNGTPSDVVISHNSGMKYDFALLDSSKQELYRWSDGKFFVQALTKGLNDTIMKSGEKKVFSETLDMNEYSDAISKAKYFVAYIKGVSDQFGVIQEGYEIKIDTANEKAVSVEASYDFNNPDIFKMKIRITNNSEHAITIQTSGQKYDFKLLDSKRNILYTWSADKMFLMMIIDLAIEPGKSVEFVEELNSANFKDTIDKAKYMQAYIAGSSDDFKINTEGYEITLKK